MPGLDGGTGGFGLGLTPGFNVDVSNLDGPDKLLGLNGSVGGPGGPGFGPRLCPGFCSFIVLGLTDGVGGAELCLGIILSFSDGLSSSGLCPDITLGFNGGVGNPNLCTELCLLIVTGLTGAVGSPGLASVACPGLCPFLTTGF